MGFLNALDALLRGKVSARDWRRLLVAWICWQLLAAAAFGIAVGVYRGVSVDSDWRFLAANAIKMPMLLIGTAVVTCPSLYVFGAIRGLRFTAPEFIAMLIMAQTVLAAVLGSLAPVVAFFAISTQTYSFMVLLTVFSCALAGVLGLRGFFGSIRTALEQDDPTDKTDSGDSERSPARRVSALRDRGLWQVLSWWLLLYMFVGAQMGWILRPFIGNPDQEYAFFREKTGSFAESVFSHLVEFLTGR